MKILADCVFDGERLLDGSYRIEVTGEHISKVTPVPPGESLRSGEIDARGGTLLPGLINTHVHAARGGNFEAAEAPDSAQVAWNLATCLSSGVTTVADMGCTPALIRALRNHTREDPLSGPSIVAAGPIITAPEGYPFDWLPKLLRRSGAALPCDNAREACRAVETVARAGMDHVKLAIMHESYSGAELNTLRPEVAGAVVREAHAQGLRVMAHAHSERDYVVALSAGVDALMHSSFEPLTQETYRRIQDSGTIVCPTLWVFESACLGAEGCWHRESHSHGPVTKRLLASWRRFGEAYAVSGDVIPPGIAGGRSKSWSKDALRVAAANLTLLHDGSVPVVFGNDAPYGYSLLGRPVDELTAMQRAGLSAGEVLRAATSRAANLLGLKDRGRIKPGLRADLLVVQGKAFENAEALGNVQAVFHRGHEVPLGSPQPLARRLRTEFAMVSGLAGTIADMARSFLPRLPLS